MSNQRIDPAEAMEKYADATEDRLAEMRAARDEARAERDRLREAGNAMADRFDALLAELSWSDEESEAERTAINGWRAVSP
jgi:hypothetical protein